MKHIKFHPLWLRWDEPILLKGSFWFHRDLQDLNTQAIYESLEEIVGNC